MSLMPKLRAISERLSEVEGRRRVGVFLAVAAFLCVAPTGAGQACEPEWLPGDGIPGFAGRSGTGTVTTRWDPDGPGPEPEWIVFGGDFYAAGPILARRIVAWDPVSGAWHSFGEGIGEADFPPTPHSYDDRVMALAVLPNGDLVAAGRFETAGGVPVENIARWDGAAWHAMGSIELVLSSGDPGVHDLAVLPDGSLIASGSIVGWVQHWDGDNWRVIGTAEQRLPKAMVSLGDGRVAVGGRWSGTPDVFVWNGAEWIGLPGYYDDVSAMTVTPGGDLLVGSDRLWRWDGEAWAMIEGPRLSQIGAIAVAPSGDIYVGGGFSGWVGFDSVARFDGTEWYQLGSGLHGGVGSVLIMPGGEILASGGFKSVAGEFRAGTPPLWHAAVWDGEKWRAVNGGFDGPVWAAAALPDGGFVVGGEFDYIGRTRAAGLAKWDGQSWHPLIGGGDPWIHSIAALPSGGIAVTGSVIEGVVSDVNLWDGSRWHPLTEGATGQILSVAALPTGEVVAGGNFTLVQDGAEIHDVAIWNGSRWRPLGDGISSGFFTRVWDLAVAPDGSVIVAGEFTSAGGVPANNIARWDGASWHALGSGASGRVDQVVVLSNGHVVAAGARRFGGIEVQGLALWNGSSWSDIGPPPVGTLVTRSFTLLARANGDLVVGGAPRGSSWPVSTDIATWDGSAWTSVGAGLDRAPLDGMSVLSLAELTNGDLVAGGFFRGEHGVAFFGHWGCRPCYADCDSDGELTFFDFLCYQNLFAAGDPAADCDGSGGLDFFDFLCFQNAFAAGCG